ncbi:MAG: tRNA lysidine(34) synthetase TilS [Treponema sp.]|nr:tRNA lysidine(34) synthetase TilS [Treponema sp.]
MLELNKFESEVVSSLECCPNDAVLLAAVSGGADSMALLSSLDAARQNGKIKNLFCMHIEHGLRRAQESLGDAEHVRLFCEDNKIKCIVKNIAPGKIVSFAKRKGIGIEAAARSFRHRALSKEAKILQQQHGGEVFILLAHTKDDLLETALMRVLRGVGPAGLAAMPKRRERLLRPILNMSRADVIEYLESKHIAWREDSTNCDTQFLRNRIRCQLVPFLNDSFPSWKKGIAAMAQTQSLVADFIKKEAGERIKWDITKTSHRGAEAQRMIEFISTDAQNFFIQPLIIREEAIFCGINILSSVHILRVSVSLCESSSTIKRKVVRHFCEGKTNAADLGSVRVKREGGKIVLERRRREFFESGISRLIIEPRLDNL